jgi:hypothetical protein
MTVTSIIRDSNGGVTVIPPPPLSKQEGNR